MKKAPTFIVLLILTFSQLSAQTIIEVTTNADEDDGVNSLDTLNDISLREAINYASSGTTITFAPSLTNGTIILTEGALPTPNSDDIVIDGTGINLTIEPEQGAIISAIFDFSGDTNFNIVVEGITCQGAVRGVVASGTTVTMNDCRLTGNRSYGAVVTGSDDIGDDGYLILNNCEIDNNSDSGVYATGARRTGVAEINDCYIHHNTAQRGGGGIRAAASEGFGNVTVRRSTISYNSAPRGGGLYMDLGSISLFDSTVSHNSSDTDGGGAYLTTGDSNAILEATRSTFSNNTAPGRGGAAFSDNGSESKRLIFDQSTVSENTADEGGAFYLSYGDDNVDYVVSLKDTTVSANTALTQGGGLAFVHAFPEGNAPEDDQFLTFENSILAGNEAPFSPDILLIERNTSSSVIIALEGLTQFSSLEGSPFSEDDEGILLSADPLLSPLGNYGGPTETMLLLPGAPAIDSALTSTETTEQRGFVRPLDGDDDGTATPDLGSTEAPNWFNPGPDDYPAIWLTDQDGDGSPWGLEQAIGTNPILADTCDPLNLTSLVVNPTGAITVLFGHNPNAIEGTTLSLARSQTLTPEDFTTLFSSSFDGLFQISEFGDQVNFTNGGTTISFLDDSPPSPKAFYLLEATYNP